MQDAQRILNADGEKVYTVEQAALLLETFRAVLSPPSRPTD